MSARVCRSALFTVTLATSCIAIGAEPAPDAPVLSASITGLYYAMRDEPDFGVGVAAINRGPLRFEARYNYEARASTSAFIGWKFAGGDPVAFEVTPIAGALFGATHAAIVGVEASVAYRAFDAYVEAEHVDGHDTDAYFYIWSEIGFRPVEWLRVGLVGQRTRIVHNDRDLQRGAFVQATIGRVTVGLFAFNPDASSRYTILSVGTAF
jgi:hypothetical protein